MPIYAYACTICDHEFEALRRASQAPPACKECGEPTVKIFALSSAQEKKDRAAKEARRAARLEAAAAARAAKEAADAAREAAKAAAREAARLEALRAPPPRPTVARDTLFETRGCYVAAGVFIPSLTFTDDTLDAWIDAVNEANAEFGATLDLLGAWPGPSKARRRYKDVDEAHAERITTGFILGEAVTCCDLYDMVTLEVDRLQAARERVEGQRDAIDALLDALPEGPRADQLDPSVRLLVGADAPGCSMSRVFYGQLLHHVDSERDEELYQQYRDTSLETYTCGRHWDDQQKVLGVLVAEIPYYVGGDPGYTFTRRMGREEAAPLNLGEAFEAQRESVDAHVDQARLYLSELTWYLH